MSPTARSLKYLRELGYTTAIVEKWNPHAKVRQDLFGFADIVAIAADEPGVLAVQACVTGDQSKRVAKIHAESRAAIWRAAGNRIEVHGWAKCGPRGKRKTWQLSQTEIP